MSTVQVENLEMVFRAPVREEGLRSAIGSLWRRQYRSVEAVKGVTFSIGEGEVVGFIGPNGAGKTTTLKMLCGILHPTGGNARVLSHVPWKREPTYLRQIAMVRGSRPVSGPLELTVGDALRFQQLVYDVPAPEFDHTLGELSTLLELGPLLGRQVRALSLGERMRAGLAMALVYRPRVLFLDEPTIGLDVTAVSQVRQFIGAYARHAGATILLTSHYMADVESLCRRVILIDKGTLRFDGELSRLSAKLSPFKVIRVEIPAGTPVRWDAFGELVELDGSVGSLRVHRQDVPGITSRLLTELPVSDLSVIDPPLESVIDRVYREGVA